MVADVTVVDVLELPVEDFRDGCVDRELEEVKEDVPVLTVVGVSVELAVELPARLTAALPAVDVKAEDFDTVELNSELLKAVVTASVVDVFSGASEDPGAFWVFTTSTYICSRVVGALEDGSFEVIVDAFSGDVVESEVLPDVVRVDVFWVEAF